MRHAAACSPSTVTPLAPGLALPFQAGRLSRLAPPAESADRATGEPEQGELVTGFGGKPP